MSSCVDDSFRCFPRGYFYDLHFISKKQWEWIINFTFSFSPFQKPHAKDNIYVQSQGKKFKIYIFEKKSLLSFRDMH